MLKWTLTILTVVGLSLAGVAIVGGPVSNDSRRIAAVKAYKEGNFKEAYTNIRLLALDPKNDPTLVPDDHKMGVDCLTRLGLFKDLDEFVESSVAAHPKNWMLLQQAAATIMRY
jgi:hypothetical protein